MRVQISAEWVRVHLCMMTLGFSRRVFVAAFLDETRCSWQVGLERGVVDQHLKGLPTLKPVAPAVGQLQRSLAEFAVRGWGSVMGIAVQALPAMLSRLKLTALRDQLDSLLDEAARLDLSLREALAFLCQAEIDNH